MVAFYSHVLVTPAPRRPRRWSRRGFGVVVRVVLVVALLAMVAWPEWHFIAARDLARGDYYFSSLSRNFRALASPYPGTVSRPVVLVVWFRSRRRDGADVGLCRDSSLGVIAPRGK